MGKIITKRIANYDFNLIYKNLIEMFKVLDVSVKRNEVVLVKPNLLGPHAPDKAVTTHPVFTSAMIEVLKSFGAIPVLGDSPSVADKYEKVLAETGMLDVARKHKIDILNFSERDVVEYIFKLNNEPIKIYLTKAINEVDSVISLPKFKTHGLMILTAAIKNLYGLVPGLLKTEYHRLYPDPTSFSKLLASILYFVKPKLKLTVIDAIVGMDGNGPANGRIRKLDFMIASGDALLMDVFLSELIRVKSNPLTKICSELKLGEFEIEQRDLFGDKIVLNDFQIPPAHYINYVPKFVTNAFTGLIYFNLKINRRKCRRCMKCFKVCPASAITEVKGTLYIDRNKCLKCMCCHEVCPHDSIEVERSLMTKICQFLKIF